jgi:ribosomal protein S18 acetylase RimI-like enzyme
MSDSEIQMRVRNILLTDLQDIFSVDNAIRAAGVSTTYEPFTTKQIFGLGTVEVDPAKRSALLAEVIKLLDLGFVVESEGQLCGFIVGRQTYLIEYGSEIGEIAIIGVHPDYQHKGIAAKLVDALCALFQSRGIRRIRIGLDPHDEDMKAFIQRMGFGGEYLISYTKTL